MNKRSIKPLISVTLMSLLLTTALSTRPIYAATGQVTRTSGSDRYATAAQVAKTNWPNGSRNVVLVSGEGYADAVSASVLAKQLDAPILLTTAKSLNFNAKAALDSLKPTTVYIIGGNASISQSVRYSLKASNYNVVELKGADRYETNIAVANKLIQLGVKADNVMLVGGEGFSDALSVAPIAAAKGQILLLGSNDQKAMEPVLNFANTNNSKVTVIGTSNVISDDMCNALGAVERVNGGADRFETNIIVLSRFASDLSSAKLFVANASGDGYADALIASALAGKSASPLVLVHTPTSEATITAINYIKTKATRNTDLNVIGGTTVVPNSTVAAINNAVNLPPVTSGTGYYSTVNLITPIGLNQIKVVFGSTVDKTSAQLVSNYQIDGTDLTQYDAVTNPTGATATLQGDNHTVIITLAQPYTQTKNVIFTVKNSVITKDLSTTIPKFEQSIIFYDISVPTLQSITVSGNNKLTIQFSEAIRIPGNTPSAIDASLSRFKVNGQSVLSSGLDSSANGYTYLNNAAGVWTDRIELYFTTPLPVGSNIFEVPNGTAGTILDNAAGFIVNDTKMNFTVNSVTDAPMITNVVGGSNGKIVITFSRAMDKRTALDLSNYYIGGSSTSLINAGLSLTNANNIGFVDGSNDTTVEITGVGSLLNNGANIIKISKNVRDSYGNKFGNGADVYTSFNVIDDNTKPTVLNVNMIDSRTLRVKFSKDVKYGYATAKSNYQLLDSSGVDISSNIDNVVATNGGTADTDTYDLKFNSSPVDHSLIDTRYTITIKNIIDTISTPNVMDDYTSTFTGINDISPKVTDIVCNSTSSYDSKKIVVFFNKAMDESTIRNPSNYYFRNSNGDSKTLPLSSTILVNGDDKSVTITLPSNYTIATTGSYASAPTNLSVVGAAAPGTGSAISQSDNVIIAFGVTNVRDQSGNTLAGVADSRYILDTLAASGPSFVTNVDAYGNQISDGSKIYYDGDNLKVQIQLTSALSNLYISDFRVAGQQPDSATLSGKYVILTFNSNNDNTNATGASTKINAIKAQKQPGTTPVISTVPQASIQSTDAAGRKMQEKALAVAYPYEVYDYTVPPRTIVSTDYSNNVVGGWRAVSGGIDDRVSILFDETIDTSIQGNYDDDFIFTNESTGKKLSVTGITFTTTRVPGDTIVYHFASGSFNGIRSKIDVRANNTVDIRGTKDFDGNNYTYIPASDDLRVRRLSVINSVSGSLETITQGIAPVIATAATAQVQDFCGDTLTIGDPSGVGNNINVTILKNTSDELAVTCPDSTHLNIALADTTPAKNTAASIQTAIRALGGNFSTWTATASGSWDTAVNGTALTTGSAIITNNVVSIAGLTITDLSRIGNGINVTISKNTNDELAVTSPDSTHLNIALADTTLAKNSAAFIQTAIRALGGNFSTWTATANDSWNDAVSGANLTAIMANGIAAIAGVTESADFTITYGAAITGNITVNVNGVAHTVALTAGQTADQVATAIFNQLTTDTVAGYTVTNPLTGVIRFTSTTSNTNVTDITVSITS